MSRRSVQRSAWRSVLNNKSSAGLLSEWVGILVLIIIVVLFFIR